MATPSQPAANMPSPGPAVESGQRAKDPAVPVWRLLAKIRELGYTRTGQQHTDAILQNGMTRARYCPRQKRMFIPRAAMHA